MLLGIIFLFLALVCAVSFGSILEGGGNRKDVTSGALVFTLIFAAFAVLQFSEANRGIPARGARLEMDTVYELRGQMPTGNGKTLANLATLSGDWLIYTLDEPIKGSPKYVKTSEKDGKVVLEPLLLSPEKG